MFAHCCRAFAGALILAGGLAQAELEVRDGWLRAVPPVSNSTAGYLELHNHGKEAAVLTGFDTEIAEAGEVHTWVAGEDGARRMKELPEVEIPPREKVTFRSGGHHLMLFRLTGELSEGDEHELCFRFERAESVCAGFEVRRDP